MAAELKVGDSLPSGTTFTYVPYTPENGDITSCGIPISYDASKEWAGKKVVLFAVPGAFTPGCSAKHLPGYIENLDKIKSKGVDIVAVIAFNDAWVMSAWGKANNIKDDSILFLTDAETAFSKKLGWTAGERTARYALIIDNGKIVYAEKEPGREVTVSSAEAVLAKL
ncbi:peroxisomal matrix protein [Phlyctema vagabunda]|uniref:Peroxisomal matrix protein n=1 Tax=Phlyctema vagabunda TaxID=108571 RepID=A0ABR4PT71_9HELO